MSISSPVAPCHTQAAETVEVLDDEVARSAGEGYAIQRDVLRSADGPYIDESSNEPACAAPTNAMAAANATGASRMKRITITSQRMLGILVNSRTTESRNPAGIL